MISFSSIEKSPADVHSSADSASDAAQRRGALGLIRAFLLNPSRSSEAMGRLEAQVQSGQDLRCAFASLSDSEQQELREQIPPQRLAQIFAITSPQNRHFWKDALYLGASLKREPVGEQILGFVASSAPPEIRAEAQGHLGVRAEDLLARIPRQVSDYKQGLVMLAGSVLGPVVEATVLGRLAVGGGTAARLAARGLGFLAEASAFGVGDTLFSDGQTSIGDNFIGAFLNLTAMKGFGLFGNRVASWMKAGPISGAAISQAAVLGGMLASHAAEVGLGRPPDSDGAVTVKNIFTSMLIMETSAHFGHRIWGSHIAALRQGVALRAEVGARFPGGNFESRRGLGPQLAFETPGSSMELAMDSKLGDHRPIMSEGSGHSGPGLSQELRVAPTLELRTDFSVNLELLESGWRGIYNRAEKRRFKEHGLDFEYAVVHADDLPHLLSVGSAGLSCGKLLFVMEDFFRDLPRDQQAKMVKTIAVRVYGQSRFHDHRLATSLELHVAQLDGRLPQHLQVLEDHNALEFRTIALHRRGQEFYEILQSEGIKVDPILDEAESGPDLQDSNYRRVKELADSFEWPPELRRYAHRLDVDMLYREKMEEWVRHVVSHEQARDYFRLATDRVLDTLRLSERENATPQLALQRAQAAFYGALAPLYLYITDAIVSEDVLQAAFEPMLRESKRAIRAELSRLRLEALASAWLERSWPAHLDELQSGQKWLDRFWLNSLPEDKTERERETVARTQVLLEALAKAKPSDDSSVSSFLEKYDSVIRWLKNHIVHVVERFQTGDLQRYPWVFQRVMVHSVEDLLKNQSEALSAEALAAILEAIYVSNLPAQSTWDPAVFSGLRHPRQTETGWEFPKYPRSSGDAVSWYQAQYQMERYDNLSPVEREGLAQYFMAYVKTPEGLNAFLASYDVSPRLAVHLRIKSWQKVPPFYEEEGRLLGFLPSLAPELKREQWPDFLSILLLRKDAIRVAAADPDLKAKLGTLAYPIAEISDRGRATAHVGGFLGEPLGWETIFPEDHFRALLHEIMERDLDSVQTALEASLEEKGVPVEQTIQAFYRFGLRYRAMQRRKAYHDPWEYSDFLGSLREEKPESLVKVLGAILKIESAKDLLSLVPDQAGFDTPGLLGELQDCDDCRRLAWSKRMGVEIPEATKVDVVQLQALAQSPGVSLPEIVEHYMELVREANPLLRKKSSRTAREMSNAALKAFLGIDDPDLQKTTAILLARGLDFDALQYLLVQQDADSRKLLLDLDLKPLGNRPQAVSILRKLAAETNHPDAFRALGELASTGHIEALAALVRHPYFDNPESVLRREVIPSLSLSNYKGRDYLKEVRQILEQLAEIPIPEALAILPFPKRLGKVVATAKQLLVKQPEEEVRQDIADLLRSVALRNRDLLHLVIYLEQKIADPNWWNQKVGLYLQARAIALLLPEFRLPREQALLLNLRDHRTAYVSEVRRALAHLADQLPPLEAALLEVARAKQDRAFGYQRGNRELLRRMQHLDAEGLNRVANALINEIAPGQAIGLPAVFATIGTVAKAFEPQDRLNLVSVIKRNLPRLNSEELRSALWAIGQIAPLLLSKERQACLQILGPYLMSVTARIPVNPVETAAREALASIANYDASLLPEFLDAALQDLTDLTDHQRRDLLGSLKKITKPE